jgi:hypothetical protein
MKSERDGIRPGATGIAPLLEISYVYETFWSEEGPVLQICASMNK